MIVVTFFIMCYALSGSFGTTDKNWRRVDIYQPNFHQTQRYRDTRSVDEPTLELLMHLPQGFKDVNAFRNFLGIRPERKRREASSTAEQIPRSKRSAEITPDSVVVDSSQVMVEDPDDLPYRPLPELSSMQVRQYEDAVLKVAQDPYNIREYPDPGSDSNNSNEARKTRRNTSAMDHEDTKRGSYPDPPAPTTTSPFWKLPMSKKSSTPTFVTQTQREGRGQNNYDMSAQHRSNQENSRESHSLKDKPMQSNEISPLRDSYYSASDPSTRRAYNSRQAESSSPKSAYDSIDFSASRRGGSGRNADSRGRLTTDSYSYTRSFTNPRPYDSRYYYPLPGEVHSRGLEYYHRTVDPGTGRIVYYATLPEPTPNYDAYSGRSLPGRAYTFDAYGRPYPAVPAYPYYPSAYPGYSPSDYLRSGRNTAEAYQRYDDRYRDDLRNKTYVIYDADEEKRIASNARPLIQDERSRYVPPATYSPYAYPAPGYNVFSPYPTYPYRNPYYPEVRGIIGGENPRRDVQLPISARSATGSYDNKQLLKPLKP